MTNTPNYQLPQWQLDDFIQMQDFNSAFSALDAALTENAGAAAANAAKLAGPGKLCRIKLGTYTGDGVDTANKRRTIACEEFIPLALLICRNGSSTAPVVCVRGCGSVYCQASTSTAQTSTVRFEWGDHAVTYYCGISGAANALNSEGSTYAYVILGVDEL